MLKVTPFAHVVVGLYFKKLEPFDYIAHWYTRVTYIKVYYHFIQPTLNMLIWPDSQNVSIIPSKVKNMLGRSKKIRRKEKTRNKTSKLLGRGLEMT